MSNPNPKNGKYCITHLSIYKSRIEDTLRPPNEIEIHLIELLKQLLKQLLNQS